MRGASLTSPPLGKHRTPYCLRRGTLHNTRFSNDMVSAEDEEGDDGKGGDEGEDEGNEGGVEPCGAAGTGVGLGRGVGLGGVVLGLSGLGGGLGSDGVVVSSGGMDIALLTAVGGAVGGCCA